MRWSFAPVGLLVMLGLAAGATSCAGRGHTANVPDGFGWYCFGYHQGLIHTTECHRSGTECRSVQRNTRDSLPAGTPMEECRTNATAFCVSWQMSGSDQAHSCMKSRPECERWRDLLLKEGSGIPVVAGSVSPCDEID